VDAQGRFTTTVTLTEGANTLNATVTDAVSNTTAITRTVNLDTVPPTLTMTAPRDGLFTNTDVVSVTGSTEVTASLTVSGTLSTVQPDGSFTAWTLLKRGENIIPVIATDAASNSTTITRTVNYSTPAWQPLQVGWNHISLPLDPLTPYMAEGVCSEINSQGGDVVEIDRWYGGGWNGHICGLPFNDFNVEIGRGYFVKAGVGCTMTPSLAATSSARRRIDVAEQH